MPFHMSVRLCDNISNTVWWGYKYNKPFTNWQVCELSEPATKQPSCLQDQTKSYKFANNKIELLIIGNSHTKMGIYWLESRLTGHMYL